jgi:protein DGCR14
MPSPTPSELGPAAVKQLMTLGTLAATPRILSRDDDDPSATGAVPGTPFHIPGLSAREALSHRLSNKASKSIRERANMLSGTVRPNEARTPLTLGPGAGSGKKGGMAPPSWTPRRADAAGTLTPAARRLLDRSTFGTAAARRADAMRAKAGWEGSSAKEKDISRVRWTPTPSPVTRRDG